MTARIRRVLSDAKVRHFVSSSNLQRLNRVVNPRAAFNTPPSAFLELPMSGPLYRDLRGILDRAQTEYDAVTNHGITQRAGLP